jgi:hypothetical protein
MVFQELLHTKAKLIWPGFTRACSLATRPTKRITLNNEYFIATHEGERTEGILTDQDGSTALIEQCGIIVSS